jgi:FMN-dependent NADH-azoreductase
MAKVLYVEASPRKARSASIEVARVLLVALAAKGQEIDMLDLWPR